MIDNIHVTGVNFPNESGPTRQDILRCCIVGDPITLEREPTNRFDPNAVRVLTGAGQIGYVPAPLAKRMTDAEIGGPWDWKIISLFGGDANKESIGCRIARRDSLPLEE